MLKIRNLLSVFFLVLFFQSGAQAQYVNVCATNDYNCANTGINYYGQYPSNNNYPQQQSQYKYPELCPLLTRTLAYGDQGQDIRRLQVVLGQEGFGYLGATGYYGPATRNVIKIFQSKYGINQTGAVGPITLSRMKSLWCGRGGYVVDNSSNYNQGYYSNNYSNGPLDVTIAPINSSGNNVTLGWSSPNAYVCDINGVSVQPNGQQIFNITAETTFTINCSGNGSGRATKTIVIKPNQTTSNLPYINLSINPTSALVNTYATLYWTSTNTSSCSLNGQSVPVSGSQQILVTSSQVAYQLSCISSTGLSTSSTVYSNPGSGTSTGVSSANITASANNINSGAAVTLNWTSTNTSSCSVTGGGSTYAGINGSQVVYPTTTTTYIISCTPTVSGSQVTNQVVVYVNGSTLTNVSLISNSNRVVTIQTGNNISGIVCAQVINSTINWGDGQTQQITACPGNQYSHTYSSNGTYNITITGNSTGQTTGTLQVLVNSSVSNITSTISANPTSISLGQSSTLIWSSTNAMHCSINGGSTNLSDQGTTRSYIVYPTTNTTYSVTCYNSSNQASNTSQVTVTVNGTAAITATITANPTNPAQGQSTTLSWSSTNATYCTITANNSSIFTNQPASGSVVVYPSISTNYQLNCYNNSGQNAASYVYVTTSGTTTSIPTANVYASTQNTYPGQSVNLNWYSSNTNSCALYGNNNLIIANQNTSGSYLVTPIQSTNYQITCTNTSNGQSVSSYVYVTVNGSSTNTQISLISKSNGYVVISILNACSVNGKVDWGDGYSSNLYAGICGASGNLAHQYNNSSYYNNQSYLIRVIDSNNTVLNTLSTTAY